MDSEPNEAAAGRWAEWRFLLGEWGGSRPPGQARGDVSFQLELGGQILARRNRVEYPPGLHDAASFVHQDLLIVYGPEQVEFNAIYFDSEGHTIRYAVTRSADPPAVVFESPTGEAGPRYRRAHTLTPEGRQAVTFAIAPPGQAFQVYTEGQVQRRGDGWR